MGILIDSSILIHFERSGKDVSAYVKGREDEDAFVSVVSGSELLHGVYRAANRKTNRWLLDAGICICHIGMHENNAKHR